MNKQCKKGFVKNEHRQELIYEPPDSNLTTPQPYIGTRRKFLFILTNAALQYVAMCFLQHIGEGGHNERRQSECNSHYSKYSTQRAPIAFLKT